MANLALSSFEKQKKFNALAQVVLPYVGTDPARLILTQVMIVLAIEGVVSGQPSVGDRDMVKMIRDAALLDDEQRQKSLEMLQAFLPEGPST
ncbi:MAG: hypothetical protein CL521_06080 [Actinobacteria bacterium]|nr:hypothetical protein [Actinomycetota bacterium]|tara:strand:- start:28 stop:303 length:276 start_codon:yes stop_codon:yes gene_type:complete